MKDYEHDTILFKDEENELLKIQVTIYAPANVSFTEKKDGDTFNYYAKTDKILSDTETKKHNLPETEFDWTDKPAKTITTKVLIFDEVNEEWVVMSTNTIHTNNAIPY